MLFHRATFARALTFGARAGVAIACDVRNAGARVAFARIALAGSFFTACTDAFVSAGAIVTTRARIAGAVVAARCFLLSAGARNARTGVTRTVFRGSDGLDATARVCPCDTQSRDREDRNHGNCPFHKSHDIHLIDVLELR